MEDKHKSLFELAELWGVQTSYWDIYGNLQTAEPEAVIRVLNALGLDISDESQAESAIELKKRAKWRNAIEPVHVVWDKSEFAFLLTLPERQYLGEDSISIDVTAADFDVAPEEGIEKIMECEFRISELETIVTTLIDEVNYRRFRITLPDKLPFGYCNLAISVGDSQYESLIISAPRKLSRSEKVDGGWGVFLPLYSLHSKKSWGVGDFSDLTELCKWTGNKGGSVVGVLPLLPGFLDDDPESDAPYEYSPYAPASRLFWNEIFIDVEKIPEFKRCAKAQKKYNSKTFQRELEKLNKAKIVDYSRIYRLKRSILFELCQHLMAKEGKKRYQDLQAFKRENPKAVEYALYRAAVEKHKSSWHSWEGELRDGEIARDDYDDDVYNYHVFVQWAASRQLKELDDKAGQLGVGLYFDLPLGVHPSSYDVYSHRSSFMLDLSAGAPPDLLFAGGQNWGFPPLHPLRLRENRYAYFIDTIRHHLKHSDILRIDHVMGFHRLFVIPQGMDSKDGVYITYNVDEFYAVLCLEAYRHDSVIIGEDLGTVPDYVPEKMREHGLNRMHILQLEAYQSSPKRLPPVEDNTLAALNTHDLPTFAGFWKSRDVTDQFELGLIDEERKDEWLTRREELRANIKGFLQVNGWLKKEVSIDKITQATLKYLAGSPAFMTLINFEDLWLETYQQNIPGTWRERANWSWRAKYSLEEIKRNRRFGNFLKVIDDLRRTGLKGLEKKEMETESYMSDDDLFLFNEGSHFHLYRYMGAHPDEIDGVRGTHFAVWAPDAENVYVIGDFNDWSKEANPLTPLKSSGIWRGFIPGAEKDHRYKFHVVSRYNGYRVDKADPFAFRSEVSPRTASIIWDIEYEWSDAEWMKNRKRFNDLNSPISIYEVHIGSWRRVPEEGGRPLTYREMAPQLVEYVKEMGFTHVEFLPVMEHPFYGSWGYQTTGYFAPTSRYGTPQDFMFLIDSLHQAGIGVILDWVPSHFPNDEYSLGFFDGAHLYEHEDPRRGIHPDWNSKIFNYSRNEVNSFLISSALFWLDKYHADGLRVDAVASMLYLDYSRKEGEWLPNEYGGRENIEAIEFLKRFNQVVYESYPDVQTIAEESTSWPMVSKPAYVGGLGFGLKWDMGWMHDSLKYMRLDPIHRKHHHNELTFRMLYAFHENFCLPLSHDEVVHEKSSLLGRMPGDEWQKFANLRLLLTCQYVQPGKKLLFMGGEFGQWSEWSHESSLDWHLTQYDRHQGIQNLLKDLNRLYREESALHELDLDQDGFEWIDANDAGRSCFTFLRRDRQGGCILIGLNFTPALREDYQIGVPREGAWREIFNSNEAKYYGSGDGVNGEVKTEDYASHGNPFAIRVTLPPLGGIMLKWDDGNL